ncbi:MAG: hypothetical protein GY909_00310 [Oligoflexia bacterium]|nr:hypothetical protein [Oligoflexia bacterium]
MHYRLLFIKFLLSILITHSSIHASNFNLLHCLGREEAMIHKNKLGGPVYNLNQTLINNLASLGSIYLSKDQYMLVCGRRGASPSVEFTKLMMVNGKEVIRGIRGLSKFSRLTLDSLYQKMPSIFYDYLNGLKSMAPTHDCLDKHIPELEELSTNFKYLERDLSVEKLFANKKAIYSIFRKLDDVNRIYHKCRPKNNNKKSTPKK